MKYISLPSTETMVRRLSFYLAMEEYVARHLGERDAFFMWQVGPSVIFGRNQVAAGEVNIGYCREHGIGMYRRKSGGGCVYADRDNVMLSFITADGDVGFAFNRFVTMLRLVFSKLGIDAVATSRNDIMIGDRKVCGTACYRVADRNIIHSTMLYDTNMEHMLNAITPGEQKLRRQGVASVRQRITLLKQHTQATLDEVKAVVRQTLCDGELTLTAADVAEIERVEQTYLDEGFIKLLQ